VLGPFHSENESPAFGRAIRKHSERDEANTLGQNSHKSLFALSPTKLILSDSQIFGGRLATVAHFFVAHADSDDLARVYRFDLAQDSEMISPTVPI
jgi:hypothetical protein